MQMNQAHQQRSYSKEQPILEAIEQVKITLKEMNRNSYLYQSCTLSLDNNNKVIEEEDKEERSDDMVSIVSVDETIDHSSKLDNLFAQLPKKITSRNNMTINFGSPY